MHLHHILSLAAAFGLVSGAGRWNGRAPVQYCIDASAQHLTNEIRWAAWTWSRESGLPTIETGDCLASRTIAYSLAMTDPFAAYAMFPNGPEPLAGDVKLHGLIDWRGQAYPRLIPVLLHETGHSYGMLHSTRYGDIMFDPPADRQYWLSPEDRRQLRSIYGESK
jgi:hypothetical protein